MARGCRAAPVICHCRAPFQRNSRGVIARMVLAHNMIHLSGRRADGITSDIGKIKEDWMWQCKGGPPWQVLRFGILNISNSRHLSSSRLQPPAKMPESPRRTMKPILSRIAGMLSAERRTASISVSATTVSRSECTASRVFPASSGNGVTHHHKVTGIDVACVS